MAYAKAREASAGFRDAAPKRRRIHWSESRFPAAALDGATTPSPYQHSTYDIRSDAMNLMVWPLLPKLA